MVTLFRQIAEAAWFQRGILGIILLAGVLVGLETSPQVLARPAAVSALHVADRVVLWLFAAEIVIKLGARGARWWEFFRDPWNVFDFAIVAVCFLPLQAGFAAVLRLVRVLRVLRLVTALPRLQILVAALLRSIPSMGYVALLLLLHFYIYAVIGVSLFAKVDVVNFGHLGRAMLTLFQIVTLEGWADIMRTQLEGGAVAPWAVVAYFISFILLGTMIILNLLIGVIMSGMQEAQEESEQAIRKRDRQGRVRPSVSDEIAELEHHVSGLQTRLRHLRSRVCESTDE